MDRIPEVSVLMGVYNAAPTLDATLDSILEQQGVELEFIVVDDGSTDGSGEILDQRAATDPRLVVIHQANAGLTVSLQRAAEKSRGRFLARQDAGGDRSLPGRLKAQADVFRDRPDVVAVGCGYRMVTADGTALCDIRSTDTEIAQGLNDLDPPGPRGILHEGSMFRADAFRQVGGYRSLFPVAQDLDLWLRLFEVGQFSSVNRICYETRYELGGISALRRAEQVALARFAAECARARRAGLPEPNPPSMASATTIVFESAADRRANYHYFVAACLDGRDARRARRHFLEAWLAKPMMLKALVRAATSWRSSGT